MLLRAKFEALLPHLDERAQRLTLAAEARSLGHLTSTGVADLDRDHRIDPGEAHPRPPRPQPDNQSRDTPLVKVLDALITKTKLRAITDNTG